MKRAWVVWLLMIVVTFATLEAYAVKHDDPTLSEFMWWIGTEWPLILVVYGVLFGGLAVHFWWQFDPGAKKRLRAAQVEECLACSELARALANDLLNGPPTPNVEKDNQYLGAREVANALRKRYEIKWGGQ